MAQTGPAVAHPEHFHIDLTGGVALRLHITSYITRLRIRGFALGSLTLIKFGIPRPSYRQWRADAGTGGGLEQQSLWPVCSERR
jgi:hypothetical protein